MAGTPIRKNAVTDTLSGYQCFAVRLVLGLITFRLLYQSMSGDPERFGFWSLLWAVFGYGVLIDFGFGYSTQKSVAEFLVKQDWEKLSRIMSTTFFFYLAAGAVVTALGAVFSGALTDLFKVSAMNREAYRQVMIVFMAGIGLMFPFGNMYEVLRGQQRIATVNYLMIAGVVANFICVVAVVAFGWNFMTLVVLSLLCTFFPTIVAARLAFTAMPRVRIHPGLFSWRTIVETCRFSLYAYGSTLSGIVRNKTDQPVIGALLGIGWVTPYLPGSKVGEMFGMFTRQIADVLSPTAAHLHAKGDKKGFRATLLNGMRYSVLVATPLYVLTAAYMDGVIRLLTGVRHVTLPMIASAELLLFWYYSLILTHSVFKSMHMMAGQEKRLMVQGMLEAALNLILSIAFTLWLRRTLGPEWAILGVALGSVVSTFGFGWGLIWRWAAREAGLTALQLFRRIILRTWVGCMPMVLVAAGLRLQPFWESGSNVFYVVAEGLVVLITGVVGLWTLVLSQDERADLWRSLKSTRA